MRRWQIVLAGAGTMAGVVACADATSGSRQQQQQVSAAALGAALATAPVGYGDLTSSYVGSAAATAGDSTVYIGCGGGRGDDHGLGTDGLMGGGIGDAFVGGLGAFGGGHGGHGPFGGGLGCAGTYSATTGRVSCGPVTLGNGLTVARSASYADASGLVQQAFDSLTTDVVNVQSTVTGTVTFTAPGDSSAALAADGGRGGHHGGHDGGGGSPIGRLLGDTAHVLSATTAVNSASDRTVSGLAEGSTARTVNATSAGTETTTGTTTRGAFTATRTAGDTTSGLVVPVQTGAATYPTAGTVIRVMTATLTYADQSPVTVTRREVVTYDGTATAQIVITENGTTRNCTKALPRGALSCS
jgi:hypothetical protein